MSDPRIYVKGFEIRNPLFREEIIEKLSQILNWENSKDPVYFGEFIDFFLDDLPSTSDESCLVGYVLIPDELPLFMDFVKELIIAHNVLGQHDIYQNLPIPNYIDLNNLKRSASDILSIMR